MNRMESGKLNDELLGKYIGGCMRDLDSVCECACPLGVPVREIVKKLVNGELDGAWRLYEKAVTFPGLVSRICDSRCMADCPMERSGGAPRIKLLEEALCRHHTAGSGTKRFLRQKRQRVLVVGGGLTGLSCAVRLANRGYPVTLMEQGEKLCGRLRSAGLLPEPELDAELARVTCQADFLEITTNRHVARLSDFEYDAALIAVGDGGAALAETAARSGVIVSDPSVRTGDFISSIRGGFDDSYVVEDYLKTGSIRVHAPRKDCGYRPEEVKKIAPPVAAGPGGYTPEQAKAEAERCLLCSCSRCIDVCDTMTFHNKEPKSLAIDMGSLLHKTALTRRVGVRTTATCLQCGACEDTCPKELNMRELFRKSRRFLVEEGTIPPAFSAFWLEDMAFSGGEEASFRMTASGKKTCSHLFFPGCQLGASDPAYVVRSYQALQKALGDVGIYQDCCGMPAQWACRDDLVTASVSKIKAVWQEMGNPVAILACPSCAEFFAEHLPEVKAEFLWNKIGPEAAPVGQGLPVAVFDPCAAGHIPGGKEKVRAILRDMGFDAQELPLSEQARCCGHGGMVRLANEAFYSHVVNKNIAQSELPYVTYCINCRDTFSDHGKRACHLLDLILFRDIGRFDRKTPYLSEKRENRRRLKRIMLEQGGMEAHVSRRERTDGFLFPEEVMQVMERRMVLDETVIRAIKQAERDKQYLVNDEDGSRICHIREGAVTYWVTYCEQNNAYAIRNVYTHRLRICE